jgi:dihydrodipicolinate synthase/N-acetylneuraminate lyase
MPEQEELLSIQDIEAMMESLCVQAADAVNEGRISEAADLHHEWLELNHILASGYGTTANGRP